MTTLHDPIAVRADRQAPLDAIVDVIVGVALVGELLVVIANVLGRVFFDTPLLWADEVSGFALSMIAFLGGAIAYRREQHVLVRTLVDMLRPPSRAASYALVDWLVLAIAFVTGYQSLALLSFRWDQVTPILGISATWIAVPLTVSMLVLAVYAVARLLRQPRMAVIASGALLVAATVLVVVFRHATDL